MLINENGMSDMTYALVDMVAAASRAWQDCDFEVIRYTPHESRQTYHLIRKHLDSGKITDLEREGAMETMNFISQMTSLDIIRGKVINDFVKVLLDAFEKETVTMKNAMLLAYVPKTYIQFVKSQENRTFLDDLEYTKDPIAASGSKIAIDYIEIDHRWVDQFGCWSATGHDGKGHMIAFFTQHEEMCVSGKIVGKVKRTYENSYLDNRVVNQLNYVKRPK